MIVQLIKGLEAARGNGTSMISLIMPPKDQVLAAVRLSVLHHTLPRLRHGYSLLRMMSVGTSQRPLQHSMHLAPAGVACAEDACR